MTSGLKIGEFASLCGATPDTVRFYEREGLLPRPARTDAQHRIYDQESVVRLCFIRRAQEIGLTLEDIRELLALRDARPKGQCRRVARKLQTRIEAIEAQIEALRRLRRRLLDNLALCDKTRSAPCPVLDRLEAEGLRVGNT